MFDLALVGAGRIGAVHAANAAGHASLRLATVVDTDPDAAARITRTTGARAATFDEVLADPAIAGLIIASPTGEHLRQARAAVAAGKAVLLEKPLDLDLDRARAAAAELSGARLLVGFNRRFDPHFAALKARLEGGGLGSLESVHIISHDPAPPSAAYARASGGLFKDMAIHDFDIARWLLGEEPTWVFAAAGRLVDPAGPDPDGDSAKILLGTASGRLTVISNSRRSAYGYDQRIEAFCSRGMASVGNVSMDTVEERTEAGVHGAPLKSFFLDRYEDAYRAEMDHFAGILAGAAPAVTFDDGIAALALAQAAGRSARTHVPVLL
jgi:myo-inositol 2-dehydrogenase/D-chiro-inositol 1-dehydrogenase